MRRITMPTCVLLLMWTTMTGSGELVASAEAEPITVIEKTKPGTAPQGSDMPAALATDATTNTRGDKRKTADSKTADAGSADVDIPLPQPATAPAPELRDPVDTFMAEKNADDAAKPPTVVPVPLPVKRAATRDEVCSTLASAAQSNGIPVPFLIRLIYQESGFNPNAVSPVGAQGMAQFMPETARTVGLDNPFDPLQAVSAAARLLRDLVQQFGNIGLAAAAYNAGPKRISDWLEKRGKLPNETRSYVTNITGQVPERWKTASAQAAISVPRHVPCQREALVAGFGAPRPLDAAPQSTRLAQSPKVMTPAVALAPHPSHGRVSMVIKIASLPRRGSGPAPIQLSAHSRVATKTKLAAAKPKTATAAHKRVQVAAASHRR
jgi:hypothetical protein